MTIICDEEGTHDLPPSPSLDYKRFYRTFSKARGGVEISIVSTLLAFGIGSVIGLIPEIMADRYARLHHGYDGAPCSSFDRPEKPVACQAGSDEAQADAAWANGAMSLLSLLSNPVVGSMSDVLGRKIVLLMGLFLACIPAAVFLVVLARPTLSPTLYYASNGLMGIVSLMGIFFASISDIITPEFRAPAYGVLLAVSYGGFAFGPSLALVLSPLHVALTSFLLMVAAFVAVMFMPETLPPEVRQENQRQQSASNHHREATHLCPLQLIKRALLRPFREVTILNRDNVIRLVTASAFLSSMVFASDATLVIYYIEDQLNVRQDDFATMFLALGLVGILLQGGLLHPLVRLLGEKPLLVLTFVCGTIHNLLYGLAKSKTCIYLALILSQCTKLNLPILSSLASKDAHAHEQGRIQGALSATNSMATALGPLSMEFVYHHTKNNLGPGFMFVYAAGLYVVGTVLVSLIPMPQSMSEGTDEALEAPTSDQADLEEPLLEE